MSRVLFATICFLLPGQGTVKDVRTSFEEVGYSVPAETVIGLIDGHDP
ncbi:MAG: hypothetical protein JRC86_02395 [Deltaproteobacteria bacterium]|nr:hypothetical protein [Deltaproteobacteria bacterium]